MFLPVEGVKNEFYFNVPEWSHYLIDNLSSSVMVTKLKILQMHRLESEYIMLQITDLVAIAILIICDCTWFIIKIWHFHNYALMVILKFRKTPTR